MRLFETEIECVPYPGLSLRSPTKFHVSSLTKNQRYKKEDITFLKTQTPRQPICHEHLSALEVYSIKAML